MFHLLVICWSLREEFRFLFYCRLYSRWKATSIWFLLDCKLLPMWLRPEWNTLLLPVSSTEPAAYFQRENHMMFSPATLWINKLPKSQLHKRSFLPIGLIVVFSLAYILPIGIRGSLAGNKPICLVVLLSFCLWQWQIPCLALMLTLVLYMTQT